MCPRDLDPGAPGTYCQTSRAVAHPERYDRMWRGAPGLVTAGVSSAGAMPVNEHAASVRNGSRRHNIDSGPRRCNAALAN